MARILNTTAKVMRGGRITIPSEIREVERIEEGCFVKVTIEKIEGVHGDNKRKTKGNRVKQ